MLLFRRQYATYFEGSQEKLYFDYVSKLIREKYPYIQIKFNSYKNINALSKSSTGRNKIAFFDYDMNDKEFRKRIEKDNKIKIYYSNISFDLWLLLHKTSYSKSVMSAHDYDKDIKRWYNFNSIKNNNKIENIKEEENIKKILQQINLEDIKYAIGNAKSIMDRKLEKDKIIINNKFVYYDNPATNVYEFLESLFVEIKKDTNIEI